jgi:hypothetical protein
MYGANVVISGLPAAWQGTQACQPPAGRAEKALSGMISKISQSVDTTSFEMTWGGVDITRSSLEAAADFRG